MSTSDHGRAASHGECPASEADAKQGHESDLSQGTGNKSPIPGNGLGELADAARSAARPAALPCQNSNNSDNATKRYRLRPHPNAPGWFADPNNRNSILQEKGDAIQRWGLPSGAEAKSAFHLRLNVASFVEYWGREHCLFFTLTDEANLHPTDFAKRWSNYLRRNGSWIKSFIRVLEPQKQGRPHYHVLVAVEWDTLADSFDWVAFDACRHERITHGLTARFRELRARYKTSAAPELIALWSLLRKVLPRHGLGRAELLPLRKGKEAISEYVGKYLEAGLSLRKHSWKGCRRVEFDRRAKNAWLSCTRVFAWHSPGAKTWRKRVAELGAAFGVNDMLGLRQKLGQRWAYHLRESITLLNDKDWSLVISALAVRKQPL